MNAQTSALGQHAYKVVKGRALLLDQPVLFSNLVNASLGETIPLEQTNRDTIAPIAVDTIHSQLVI